LLHRGPQFELMATARLSLDEVHDSIHTHDLQIENLGKSVSRSCCVGGAVRHTLKTLYVFRLSLVCRTLAKRQGAEMSKGINAYIILVKYLLEVDVHVTVHRDKFLIIKPTRCTNF